MRIAVADAMDSRYQDGPIDLDQYAVDQAVQDSIDRDVERAKQDWVLDQLEYTL